MDRDYRRILDQIYVANYDTYHRLAISLLRHYIKHTDYAEDIVHDAFVLAAEKAEQSCIYPEAWIAKTIRYLCLNYARTFYTRNEKMPMVAQEIIRKESASIESEADFWATLEQHLPRKEYELMEAFYRKGLSVEEIAQATHTKPNTVRVNLYRIRKNIAEIFMLLVTFFLCGYIV